MMLPTKMPSKFELPHASNKETASQGTRDDEKDYQKEAFKQIVTQVGQGGKIVAAAPTEEPSMSIIEYFCKCLRFSSSSSDRDCNGLLGPLSAKNQGKKTLVLDLDETLVHASFEFVVDADLVLEITIQGHPMTIYIKVRPGVQEFLQRLAMYYEIVVFTASLNEYADPVIDYIDPKRTVSYRLFRESCTLHEGSYVKDLSRIGRNLKDIIIIDNSENSYLFHPLNGILIKNYFDDAKDDELYKLTSVLEFLAVIHDVRPIAQWMQSYQTQESISYLDMNKQDQVYHKKNITLKAFHEAHVISPRQVSNVSLLRPTTFLNSPKGALQTTFSRVNQDNYYPGAQTVSGP